MSKFEFQPEEIVCSLYQSILGRSPDELGFLHHTRRIREGTPLTEVVGEFLISPEFAAQWRRKMVPDVDLPNLKRMYPSFYENDVYVALEDDRINLMEKLLSRHHYYDSFGVWGSTIDKDKLNMAQLVRCMGGKSCLEIGCFNGPVLSVLHDQGFDVTGIDLSHLAFVIAFPNIRDYLIYGDLLTVTLSSRYDSILLLDIMEHLNPLRIDRYIRRLRELLNPNGVIIMNSPMFGLDSVFGTVFPQNLPQWQDVGDRSFYRHWPCDETGWPMHGHLVWASPAWWTQLFESDNLIRQAEIERTIQRALGPYFVQAPARKSLVVFSHRGAAIDVDRTIELIGRQSWV